MLTTSRTKNVSFWGIKRVPPGLQFSGVSKRLKAINFYAGTLGKFCPIYNIKKICLLYFFKPHILPHSVQLFRKV